MAEGTIEAQEEILLDSKNTLVKQLGEMIKSSDLDLKDRKSARQQRDKLIKGNNTLGSDLKKNVQDLKDGVTTTVDGFINETFGPIGGMVSSLTTGFFKRGKEQKDARDLQMQELEAAEDMVKEFKGQKGGTPGGDLKRTADAVEFIANQTETETERNERLSEEKKGGGAVAGGKKDLKTSEFEFGALGGGLTALSVALGAAGGLVAGPLFQLQNLPKIIDTFKMKTVPKLRNIFNKDMPKLITSTETWGNQTKNVVRNAKGHFVKISDTTKFTQKGFAGSFDDLATKIKDIGKSFKMLGAGDEVAGLGGKFATVAKTLATGVAGRALSIAGNPVFSYIAMGKDVFDVANAVTDDDVKTSVKKEDIGGLIGGFIGGAIGAVGGPAGIALGMGLGNMAGEFIGGAMDAPEVLGAIKKVRDGLTSERTALANEITEIQAKLDDPKNDMTDAMRKMLQAQVDANTSRVTEIDAELKDMESLKEKEEELKAIEKKANDAVELKKSLEKQLALAEERGDDARVKMLEGMIENADKEFEIQEKAYETKSEELRKQAAATSEGLKDNVLSFFDNFSFTDNPVTNFFSNMFGGDDSGQGLSESEILQQIADLEAKNASVKGRGAGQAKNRNNRLIKQLRAQLPVEGKARGGIIVNRPTYLPSSGIVVGEHGTYTGKGYASGGISDGGPEAIVPLGGVRGQQIMSPLAQSIAGSVMNQLQMDRVGLQADTGGGSQNVIDSSSTQIVNNNTIINPPKPSGPMLPGAGRDTAVSHFRHAA